LAKSQVLATHLVDKNETVSKSILENVTDMPAFVPVILSVVAAVGLGYRRFLIYLNKKQMLQVEKHKNILDYKIKMAQIKNKPALVKNSKEGASNE
jgi:hypothetical protein